MLQLINASKILREQPDVQLSDWTWRRYETQTRWPRICRQYSWINL